METRIAIEIDGELQSIEVHENAIEGLNEQDLETIIANTRRVAEIMLNNNRNGSLDLQHLFTAQIEIHVKHQVIRDEYERYKKIMEDVGSRDNIIDFYNFVQRKGPKGNNSEISDNVDHIANEGWNRGTLVVPIKGGRPRRIISVSINGRLNLEGKNGNYNPRQYTSYKVKT